MRQIMRSSLDYTRFAQLCGRSPIMRKIMCAHNRIIPWSLGKTSLDFAEAVSGSGISWAICKSAPNLFFLRHRCCSSAATSRRHCFSHRTLHHSVYCVTDFGCNTVRCPVTDLFVKCHLKLHIVIDIDSRQATTPAPHHSVFYRPDAFSAAQPTASKHWLFISAAVLSAQQILLFVFSSSCYLLLLMCSMPMQRTQSVYCQHIAVCRMWSHDHRYAILHYTRLTASFPGQPG